MLKKTCHFIVILLLLGGSISSAYSQKVAAKTNFAYWAAAGSPNLELEFALSKKTTLELGGGLNLWNFDNGNRAKHWLAQPELRWWTCEAFNGHFFGVHAHGAQFNVGGWDIPVGRLSVFKDHRYEGYLYGAGLSYGYQWILSPRWNFEMSLGGGFARIHYTKYPCVKCAPPIEEADINYFGVTKAAISLVYFIK